MVKDLEHFLAKPLQKFQIIFTTNKSIKDLKSVFDFAMIQKETRFASF